MPAYIFLLCAGGNARSAGWHSPAIAFAWRRDSLRFNVTRDENQGGAPQSQVLGAPRSQLLDEGGGRAEAVRTEAEPEFALTAEPVKDTAEKARAAKEPGDLTPFMRQWAAAKKQNPDALLFFRMGDFYELFYDDAAVASRELQLTLTARDKERNIPMCGVPYHAVEQYLTRLLRKGYRIALCDQMEDPKLTKKLVRREVTRVLTPGTALDAGLGQEQNNFLAALWEVRARAESQRKTEAGPSTRPAARDSLRMTTGRGGEIGLRGGAAGCFDGRVSHGGVSRRERAGAGGRCAAAGRAERGAAGRERGAAGAIGADSGADAR